MKCNVIEKKDFIIVEIDGFLEKNVPFSVRDILHPWQNRTEPKIAIDLGGIDEDGDIIAQLTVIIAFKKEVDLMNGFLKICSLKPNIRSYMFKNRLDGIFDIYEDLNSAENSPWERKRHGEKRRYNRTAA
jgi:anti-anti-sigma regulatory factor